jgi:pyruvate formate lyase activating enzyme
VEGNAFERTSLLGYWMEAVDVFKKLETDRIFMDESQGGITISGGEPLSQPGFTAELAQLCHSAGIHVALDTSGYASHEALLAVMPWVELFLFDLKHSNSPKHKQFTGVENHVILNNLQTLVEAGKKVIIRFPVIPNLNDDMENAQAILHMIQSFKGKVSEINLLPYHALARHKYEKLGMPNPLNHIPEAGPQHLNPLKQLFEQAGLTVKIGG